jgi:catechol 2,3-dioxygenase-like lactoylglutathione lyase family enzyme
MASATTSSISPFFIVRNVERTLAFYNGKLGFEVTFQEPGQDPFFAIIRRDGAQLFVKSVDKDVQPMPNSERHPAARWDAYVYVPDPDTLSAEFSRNGAIFSAPLKDTHDGLRGFEIKDPDGYVLFFGRTR